MGTQESKGPISICEKFDPERPGESSIYRNSIKLEFDSDRPTLFHSFAYSAKKFSKENALGWRTNNGPFEWINYSQFFDYTKEIGSALIQLGLKPHESKVGIYSINRHEWLITEQACHAFSLCLVPLYDTLGKDAVSFIVNESEMEVIFCSGDKLSILLPILKNLKSVQLIISFDPLEENILKQFSESSIKIFTWTDFWEIGKQNLTEFVPPEADELATICYTSGTTGLPKGVMLSHKNIIADILAVFHIGIVIGPGDVHISYLPLAHVYEKNVSNAVIYYGAAIGFYRGDVRLLFDDILELKPTVFSSVPRLYNRLYDKVMQNVKVGGITQYAFDVAYEAKLEGLKKGQYTHPVYDALVFNKVKAKLGGRVKIMMTASAPISEKILEFLRVVFGCPIIEGYGQTETSAGATMTNLTQTDCGHVGFPLPGIDLKLVDVPSMNYISTDEVPRGEVCFRGPVKTSGYYKNPEKTAELIDEYGWLHTGDVGMILPNRTLKIIDRVKNIFKPSGRICRS